jgi:hypothetical protein
MSEWTSRVRNHRIWGLMQELGPLIDKAVALDTIDTAALDALERIRSVLALCGKKLGGTDPLTIPPTLLDSLAGAIETQKNEIDAFIGDLNQAHLSNANASADSTLAYLAQIPGASTPQELIGLIDAVNAQRAAVEEHAHSSLESRKQARNDIESLKGTIDGFKAETQAAITDLKSQLDVERQKISTQSSEQQKLFADGQEARSNTYNETIRKIQENLTHTLTDQQGQFSAAQENRNREFTSAQSDAQKRFGDLMGEYTKRLADQDAEFTKQRDVSAAAAQKDLSDLTASYSQTAQTILDSVNEKRRAVEKLVGVIGNLGVTSGYQTTANQARITMWVWQIVAVLAMGGVIYFAYHAFLPALKGEFTWEGFATRVFLTITVGVLAAYAASQADRFFQMEKSNRKLALELAAIDPFIALLPAEEQQKFKLEVGKRTFAQEETSPPHKSDKSPATTLDVLLGSNEGQQLLKLLSELVEKIPKLQ